MLKCIRLQIDNTAAVIIEKKIVEYYIFYYYYIIIIIIINYYALIIYNYISIIFNNQISYKLTPLGTYSTECKETSDAILGIYADIFVRARGRVI